MNPIFIEVNGGNINITSIVYYGHIIINNNDCVKVRFQGIDEQMTYPISVNEFKAKIDEALAKKN